MNFVIARGVAILSNKSACTLCSKIIYLKSISLESDIYISLFFFLSASELNACIFPHRVALSRSAEINKRDSVQFRNLLASSMRMAVLVMLAGERRQQPATPVQNAMNTTKKDTMNRAIAARPMSGKFANQNTCK